MLHRALFGSIERFIGILIENYAGRLPLWLSPTQLVIATITSDANDYANQIYKKLKDNNIRADIDLRNEKIGYKIREHSNAKIPILMILGKKEAEQKSVSIRRLGSNDTEIKNLDETIPLIVNEAKAPN